MQKQDRLSLADRIFYGVAWCLLMVIGLSFITVGIGMWINPNPKYNQFGNAVAVDLFITLGATSVLGALAHLCPNVRFLRRLADETFKKLCIFVLAFGIGLLIVLLWP